MPPVPTVCLHPFSSHADIPDTCVHYTGGFLDALIQGLKEVRALVQGRGQGKGLYSKQPVWPDLGAWGGGYGKPYNLSQAALP